MRRVSRAAVYSTDEDSVSEEALVNCKRRKTAIKSDKLCMADTTVLRQLTWPHELVYGPGSQPPTIVTLSDTSLRYYCLINAHLLYAFVMMESFVDSDVYISSL